MLTLRLDNDCDAEDPNTMDGSWRVYSFNSRHVHYQDPETLFHRSKTGVAVANEAQLRHKLKVGLAFLLDYFEHGDCRWSIHGEGYQCRWDTSRYAGLIIWEEPASNMGAKTVEERAEDARHHLKHYTAWCNGRLYMYQIVDDDEEEAEFVGWCGGWWDTDDMFQEIRSELAGRIPDEVEGDATWLTNYHSYEPPEAPNALSDPPAQ